MLTKATEYAIRALVYIVLQNQLGKRPGFKEIALQTGSPGQFTAKILQRLTRNQIIRAAKGPGGGFFFENTDPLPLYRVIILVEGEQVFNKCGFGLKNCSEEEPCPLHEHYKPIRESIYQLAITESIQSLANKVTNHQAVLFRNEPWEE